MLDSENGAKEQLDSNTELRDELDKTKEQLGVERTLLTISQADLKSALAKQKRLTAAERNLSVSYVEQIVIPKHPWFAALVRQGIPKYTCDGSYTEIKWKDLDKIDPKEKTANRKQSKNLLIQNLPPHQRDIHDTVTSLFFRMGYARWRYCSIITGGNVSQHRHTDQGLDSSYSVLVALTERKFTICHTDNTHREIEIALDAGDVLVFNTQVWHAGGVNEVESAAIFMYYDLEPGFEGAGYNYMANPHSHWDFWGDFAIRHNDGQEQEICYPHSLDDLPMRIFRLGHPIGTKVLHGALEKQFTQ